MPGDFEFEEDSPPPPPRKPPRAEPVDEPRRRTSTNASPLVWAGIAGGLFLVIGGGVAIAMFLKGASPETKEKATPVATTPAKPAPPPKAVDPVNADQLSQAVIDKVSKATVRVDVLFKDGKGGSGSGFFEKSSGFVLTNAHVVGKMKGEPGPAVINLVLHSGEGKKEFILDGELLAWDEVNDLALLRASLIVAEVRFLPEGLVVPKSPELALTQKLFVFGFPLGKQIGSEISVRPATVTSFRNDEETGSRSKIQVEGGMTFGNSGGPVVDAKGNVVGVAVSGIVSQGINFAVPGEIVQKFIAAYKKKN